MPPSALKRGGIIYTIAHKSAKWVQMGGKYYTIARLELKWVVSIYTIARLELRNLRIQITAGKISTIALSKP